MNEAGETGSETAEAPPETHSGSDEGSDRPSGAQEAPDEGGDGGEPAVASENAEAGAVENQDSGVEGAQEARDEGDGRADSGERAEAVSAEGDDRIDADVDGVHEAPDEADPGTETQSADADAEKPDDFERELELKPDDPRYDGAPWEASSSSEISESGPDNPTVGPPDGSKPPDDPGPDNDQPETGRPDLPQSSDGTPGPPDKNEDESSDSPDTPDQSEDESADESESADEDDAVAQKKEIKEEYNAEVITQGPDAVSALTQIAGPVANAVESALDGAGAAAGVVGEVYKQWDHLGPSNLRTLAAGVRRNIIDHFRRDGDGGEPAGDSEKAEAGAVENQDSGVEGTQEAPDEGDGRAETGERAEAASADGDNRPDADVDGAQEAPDEDDPGTSLPTVGPPDGSNRPDDPRRRGPVG